MDSTKNQLTPTLIVSFRSVRFRDSPILVYNYRREDSPHTERNLLVWCGHNERKHILNFKWCIFCGRYLDNTVGYYIHDGGFYGGHTIGFHKECIESTENNPYHPKHSLQILRFLGVESNKVCYCCNDEFKQCFRYCSICNFSICRDCIREPPLLTIDHKKRHEHTLSYIPREASMTCDVCGLDDRRHFIYVCHQCDFVVHKECIYSPWIIKISRHQHRLSFTSSFIPGNWFCGVCRKKFDENYGGYSCVDKGCYYVVHSKCATRKDIWDGEELEGVPEEEDVYEDIAPFKEISDGIIQHFSHNHHMRLRKEIYKANEESIYCQACALLVYDGDTFSCMECDFVLHKVCAYLPRKKQLVLHPHPLVLQNGNPDSSFDCSACRRVSNGFRYNCDDCVFVLDMHCASVSEPLDHQCHPHPLFLPSIQKSTGICTICQQCFAIDRLECGECDFVLCFHCATLPTKFMYKMHDEHPLILLLEQDASGQFQYWCDVCEKEIYAKNGIYICKDCNISVHVNCLLGEYKCMLPGKEFMRDERKFDLLPNNHLTRYICNQCHKRCQNKIVYKTPQEATYYCSMECSMQISPDFFS